MSERPALKPAYLISGSDRPKVDTAVHRLRARFVARVDRERVGARGDRA